MIDLGDKVKDSISGYVGIVVAKTEYLFGTPRIVAQSTVNWVPINTSFDEGQLVKIAEEEENLK